MTNELYLPDLDDGDFRRIIDARRLVIIKFWSAEQGQHSAYHGAIARAAEKHPEVAFAQSNVDLHHNLQGWVDGNLVKSQSGELDENEIEGFIREIKTHKITA